MPGAMVAVFATMFNDGVVADTATMAPKLKKFCMKMVLSVFGFDMA